MNNIEQEALWWGEYKRYIATKQGGFDKSYALAVKRFKEEGVLSSINPKRVISGYSYEGLMDWIVENKLKKKGKKK